MAFSLRNFLEEKWADVNMFDGGRTGATVRNARQKPAPAQTPSPTAPSGLRVTTAQPTQRVVVDQPQQPKPQIKIDTQQFRTPDLRLPSGQKVSEIPKTPEDEINARLDAGRSWEDISRETGIPLESVRAFSQSTRPNYGVEIARPNQSFGNKLRDVFDANTQADMYRRQEANKERVRIGGTTASGQVPIVSEDPGNLASNTIGAVPRMFNTAANQAVEVGFTVQQQFATAEYGAATEEYRKAVASGDQNAIAAARFRLENASKRVGDINNMIEATKANYKTNSGGLLNAGTMYNEEDSYSGDLATGIRKVGGNTLEGMFDVASLGVTGASGKIIAKEVGEQGFRAGVRAGIKKQVPNIIKNAWLNSGQGASSAYRQGASLPEVAATAALTGAVGTVADTALAVTGGTVVPKVIQAGRALKGAEDGFVKVPGGADDLMAKGKKSLANLEEAMTENKKLMQALDGTADAVPPAKPAAAVTPEPVAPAPRASTMPDAPTAGIENVTPPAGKKPLSPKIEQANLDEIKISTKTKKAPIKDRASQFIDDVQSAAIDRYHAIDQFVEKSGKKLAPSEDPRYLVKRYMGGMGIASQKIDDTLKPIIKQTDDFDGLRKYLVAARMTELNERGIGKSGEAAIAQLGEKVGAQKLAQFQKIADELYAYQRKGLEDLLEVGAISKEQFDAITTSNQKYVPFTRVMDDLEQAGFIPKSGDLNVKSNNIKRIKGSEREIVDPIESIIRNTYDIQKTVEKQRVLNSMVKLGEFEKIDPKIVPVGKITNTAEIDSGFMKQLSDFAKERGLKGFKTEGKAGKKLGFYTPGEQTVTRKFATSSQTAAHEIGHFLDHKYGLKQKFYARGATKELGKELTENMRRIGQSSSRTGKPEERFAHAFELWMTHRDLAERDLSLFSKRMAEIVNETPGLKGLNDIRPTGRAGLEMMDETVFGKSPFEPKEPHITVLEDGKPVYYKVSKQLADAVKGIDEEQLNLAIRTMALPARLLRAGATSVNVGFAVPNVIRDQLSAAINNKYGGIPMYDFVSGLASVLKQDDYFKRWMLSGADQASFFAQDRTMLRRSISDVTGGKFARTGKLVKNPLELLRAVGEFSEKGSRVGVYKRALRGAAKEGFEGMDLELAAMKEARESTIDFARRGSKMKAYNAITPFLNARLQGSLKLLNSAKKRPIQTGLLGMAYAGVPAAVLYAHNSQFEEYDELPDYIKDNNFIIMTGNSQTPFIKIPKGEIGSIFGNPVEKFLAGMKKDDPDAFKDTIANIGTQFLPVNDLGSAIPTAASVPMQLISNYDTFRDQNIVSPYKKDLPPELQFDKSTSETAKKVGQKLGVSPAKLEFGFRGITAGVGKQALQVGDMLLGNKPPVQEMPVIDRFLGEQKDLSKSAQEIYEQTEKLKQERALENYEIKQALERGDYSVLEGLSSSRRSSLERSVRDDLILDNLTPRQRALYNSSQEQRDMLRESADSKTLKDLDYVETIRNSGTSSGGKASLSDREEQAFMNSNKKTMTKGNTTFFKKRDGTIGSKSTFEYEYDRKESTINLNMDRAKASNSLGQWMASAEEKLNMLEQKKGQYDPETEGDLIDKITLQQENLLDTIAKYQDYGGFRKGSSKSKTGSKLGLDFSLFGMSNMLGTQKSLRQLLNEARLR